MEPVRSGEYAGITGRYKDGVKIWNTEDKDLPKGEDPLGTERQRTSMADSIMNIPVTPPTEERHIGRG